MYLQSHHNIRKDCSYSELKQELSLLASKCLVHFLRDYDVLTERAGEGKPPLQITADGLPERTQWSHAEMVTHAPKPKPSDGLIVWDTSPTVADVYNKWRAFNDNIGIRAKVLVSVDSIEIADRQGKMIILRRVFPIENGRKGPVGDASYDKPNGQLLVNCEDGVIGCVSD